MPGWALLLFMIWHEATLGYFIGGCYHGLGIVAWQLFQEYKYKNKMVRKFMMKPAVGYVSIFLTFNFVALGVPLYMFDAQQVVNIFANILTL